MLLLIAFVVLAGIYSVVTPLYEAPDEVGHFIYIYQLLTTHSLPVQRVGELGQSHQPPLYYIVAAIAASPADMRDGTGGYRPNPHHQWSGGEANISLHSTAETFPYQGQSLAIHLARLASVLMGALTLGLTIRIGRKLFPDRPSIGLLAAALIAFNPQFLFISGALNTDNLLTLCATGIWWQALRVVERPDQKRQWLYLGLWISAATLSKFNGILLGAVAGAFLAIVLLRRRSGHVLMRGGAIVSLVVIVLTGWWFVRNQVLYGDVFGWTMYQSVGFGDVRARPLTLSDFPRFVSAQTRVLEDTFRSFWGVFGWMNVTPPDGFYLGVQILSIAALLGIGLYWLRSRRQPRSGSQKTALLLCGFVIAAQELFFINVISMCRTGCSQGRYFFPAIAPLTLLMSIGLIGWLPKRWARVVGGGVSLMMAATAIGMPFNVIGPAYHIVPLPKAAVWSVPHKTNYAFEQMIALIGYEVQVDQASAKLILYWQALRRPDANYSAFVQLIDPSDRLVMQDDRVPGRAQGYALKAWLPEDVVADEREFDLSALPARAVRFRIGLYARQISDPLPITSNGQPVGDMLVLDQMVTW